MKAYRVHSQHNIQFEEMEALPVGENCVKLKNLMCAITPTDIAVYEGRLAAAYPVIPVRQSVGFVSEVGENVSGIQRGNRVVMYPQASCHSCKACKDSRYYDCEHPSMFGVKEDGFLSDFSVASVNDVYIIPERIKDEEAVFIEHVARSINALSALDIEKGEQLVIMGATVEGIILAQVAMYYQAVPIVVDMNEDMLRLAQKLGVYFTVNAVSEDVCKKILSLTGGHMGDACAYMVDSTLPLSSAASYTAVRGKVAVIGNELRSDLVCNIAELLKKNIDLITVVECGKSYSSAINLLANRTVSVEGLYEDIVPFDAVRETYDKLVGDPEDHILKTLVKI